jgi:anthraniloyl-CoA monooxygenase
VAYEEERRPEVEALQRAAQVSLEWFEETERYHGRLEPPQFAVSLLTRSLRVTHDSLRLRDPAFVSKVDRWLASEAERQSRVAVPAAPAPPPMFTPFRLRGLVLPNRVVVSSMCQYSADDGTPDEWHLVHLGSRAVGGAGLVMTEMTDVSREGRISPGCAGMYTREHVTAWKRIVDFVHGHSPAKIGLQLAHAGRKGSTRRLWEGIDEPLDSGNWALVSASPIPYFPHSQVPKAMERTDMDTVRMDFVRATRMAEEAGFDLLELHFAHGYLLASFLSPLTNRRADEYGGSLANRARFPLEIFDAARAAWPEAKPMSVRISATDWAEGGTTPDDAVEVARLLKAHGCDIVDVSAGQTVPEQKPVYGRLFQTPFADRIRHEAGIPTMTVGNIASYADVNSIIAAGRADLCVLARAHLYDPYWTRHAAYEQGYDLPWPDQYVPVQGFTPRLR